MAVSRTLFLVRHGQSVFNAYYAEHGRDPLIRDAPLSEIGRQQVEAARAKVARFIGAPSGREVVYTRNASEAINLVAYAWALPHLQPGDEVRDGGYVQHGTAGG